MELCWADTSAVSMNNRWGWVVVTPAQTSFSYGCVPEQVLRLFKRRKQYMFLLETVAQCFILWCFGPELGKFFVTFCDNTGSHFSLIKGMTKDPEVNVLVGLFWSVSGILGLVPWIAYVNSAAQLADGLSREDLSLPMELC